MLEGYRAPPMAAPANPPSGGTSGQSAPVESAGSVATYNFVYKNHRGETALRRVIPIRVRWGATQWHPKTQWLLVAFDVDHRAEREFAMVDVSDVHGNSSLLIAPAEII